MEAPLLCSGAASSFGHHVDFQGRLSPCLVATRSVRLLLGLLPLSSSCSRGRPPHLQTDGLDLPRWHHQLLTRFYSPQSSEVAGQQENRCHCGRAPCDRHLGEDTGQDGPSSRSCRAGTHSPVTLQPFSPWWVHRRSQAMAPCRGTARRPSAGRPISRRCLEVRSAPFAQGQGWIEVGCPGSGSW